MTIKEAQSILLIEDKADLQDWLCQLLGQAFSSANVISAGTLKDALSNIQDKDFDIALIDLGLPDGSGIDAIKALNSQQTKCIPVVMTIFDDSDHLFSALKAGAYGYLLKDEDDDDLLDALNGILAGKPPISPKIAQKMIEHFQDKRPSSQVQLTDREKEVLSLIAKGFSVKKTAELLRISRHTISDHVKQIYKKLNINSRAEATIKAIDLGLVAQDVE